MHLSTIALLALAAKLTHSQVASLPDLSKLPACAQKSAVSGIGATDCEPTDITCICKSPTFIRAVGTQIAASCSPEDQKAALQFAHSICQPLGVTVPSEGLDDSSASAQSSAAPASTPAPSTTPESATPSASVPQTSITAPPYPVAGNGSNATSSNTTSIPFAGAASTLDHAVVTTFAGLLFAIGFIVL